MKFDPMTGEPINEEPVQESPKEVIEDRKPIGFDPMTGDPIYEGTPQEAEDKEPTREAGGFDPMTGAPTSEEKKNSESEIKNNSQKTSKSGNNKLVVIGVVACVAVLICICLVTGVFTPKAVKIAKAAKKTFSKQPDIVSTFGQISDVFKGEYTIDFEGSFNDHDFEGGIVYSDEERQFYSSMDVGFNLSLVLGVDNEKFKMSVPGVLANTHVYYYGKKNEGALVNDLEYSAFVEIDKLDLFLGLLNPDITHNEEYKTTVQEFFKAYLKKNKFKKAEPMEIKVAGNDKICKGYAVPINEDDFDDLIDILGDLNNRVAKDYLEDIVDDYDEGSCNFYIDKGKLVAIIITDEDNEDGIGIEFRGEDYPLQSIAYVKYKDGKDKAIITMKGSKEDGKEQFKLSSDMLGTYSLSYEKKTGELTVKADTNSGISLAATGILEVTPKSQTASYKLKKLSWAGEKVEDADLSMELSSGADLMSYKGKTFDMGSASNSDLYDEAREDSNKVDTHEIEEYYDNHYRDIREFAQRHKFLGVMLSYLFNMGNIY